MVPILNVVFPLDQEHLSSRPAVESGLGPAPKHGEAARMRKPVLLVGQGMLAKEERLLKELADRAQIPVTTTLQGLARILFKKKSQMNSEYTVAQCLCSSGV
jgi:hypothetical protein